MASTTIKKLLDICLAIQLGIVGYFYFDAIYKALTYGPPKSGFGLAGVPVAIYTAAIAIVITPFIVTEWQSTKGLRGRVFLILCLPGVAGIPLDDLLGSPYEVRWTDFLRGLGTIVLLLLAVSVFRRMTDKRNKHVV